MNHTTENQKKKFFIGLELRTDNHKCSFEMPAHKEKFFSQNILAKIPNKVNGNILAVYTDYEGDYTKPYSWILGAEVSSLDEIPEGLVGKVIPESTYAVFTTKGSFPQGLIAAWQAVWQANLPRSYTTDFEVYPSNFDPERHPEVKVYIALESSFLKIRKAQPEDTGLVLQMIRELADFEQLLDQVVADEETLKQSLFADPKGPEVLIAEENGQPVGFVLFFHNFSTFLGRKGIYIEDLYVRSEYRGKGYGELILKEICRLAKERNCGRVEWWVLDWNDRAINFYKKIGAVPMSDWTVFRLTEDSIDRLRLQTK